jgi:TolA-binding protein
MHSIISRNIRYLLPFMALLCASAQAGSLDVPHTFTGGTPAVAGQVNANFSSVETAVNDNHARIVELEAQVAQLQSQVAQLQASMPSAQTLEFIDNLAEVMALQGNNVVFNGVNVHVRNGQGSTTTVNGLGNLIVGYDETRATGNDKSGSHNIVLGRRNNYTQYGGLVAGSMNEISAPFATVTGGSSNIASGGGSSISGGSNNTAEGDSSSVSGGFGNTASGANSSVSGGSGRSAPDEDNWRGGSFFADN